MIRTLRQIMGLNADMLLVFGMIGILVVLFAPIPPRALDFLLLLNLSFALLLLLMTFYVEKPVEFSTYPSLLLIATLFRLSLNIAATRLILGNADAGRVIGAIGSFVVQGNYVIGMVVFLILVVVQYVVVTSGAQRVPVNRRIPIGSSCHLQFSAQRSIFRPAHACSTAFERCRWSSAGACSNSILRSSITYPRITGECDRNVFIFP